MSTEKNDGNRSVMRVCEILKVMKGHSIPGMTLTDIVRVNAYVTDRAHMKGYMESRDAHVGTPPPASTLMIVSGFTLPEFKVEIEVVAAAPEKRRKTARSTSAPKF